MSENLQKLKRALLVLTTIGFIGLLCSLLIPVNILTTGIVGRQVVIIVSFLVFFLPCLLFFLCQYKPAWTPQIVVKTRTFFENPKSIRISWTSGWIIFLSGVLFFAGIYFSSRFWSLIINLIPIAIYCILTGFFLLIATYAQCLKNGWDHRQLLKPVWDVIDLILALALLVLINGSTFPISDHTNMVALVYKLQNPNLYLNDIGFGVSPFGYSYFFTQYLNIFSRLVPLSWVMILSNILTQLILLVALRRLVSQIGEIEIPAMGLSLLLLGLGGNDLIAGYHFTSLNYSSHYTAIALVLLAISYFISGRKWITVLLFLLSMLFNIRNGLFGVGFILLILFWRTRPRMKFYLSLAAFIGLVALLGCLFWFQNQPANQLYNEIVRIWVYFRSPAHYMPFLFPYQVVNLTIIAIFTLLVFFKNHNSTGRAVSFAGLTFIAGIAVNIINNSIIFNPVIIIGQFWSSAFLIIGLFYVFSSIFLVQRIQRGYIISSIIIFLASDYQTRSLLLVLMMVIEPIIEKKLPEKGFTKDVFATAVNLLLIFILPLILPQGWLHISYNPLPISWFIVLAIASTIVILTEWRNHQTVIIGTAVGCFAAAVMTGSLVGIVREPFSKDRSWVEVTDFATNQTTIDSTFVINPAIDTFQVLSKRSAFVTFKHLPSSSMGLFPEWFKRMQMLRVVPEDLKPGEINQVVPQDWEAYDNLTTEDFQKIKKQYDFLDYIIVKSAANLEFPLIFENEEYKVYGFAND